MRCAAIFALGREYSASIGDAANDYMDLCVLDATIEKFDRDKESPLAKAKDTIEKLEATAQAVARKQEGKPSLEVDNKLRALAEAAWCAPNADGPQCEGPQNTTASSVGDENEERVVPIWCEAQNDNTTLQNASDKAEKHVHQARCGAHKNLKFRQTHCS
ncbi:hypothetical protein TRVL_05463 [Trypanosoma vivax]|nr:hypothetical protein TRVL_05463 [Trypanosoma vivax]